jgi:hypothetical protein
MRLFRRPKDIGIDPLMSSLKASRRLRANSKSAPGTSFKTAAKPRALPGAAPNPGGGSAPAACGDLFKHVGPQS